MGANPTQQDLFDDLRVIPELRRQVTGAGDSKGRTYFNAEEVDLESYDRIVLCLSSGKDSIACWLDLLDRGVNPGKVEFWHHDVDGREGSTLFDWPFMRQYTIKLAQAFGVPLYFSWLDGGLEGEMLKRDGYSRPHWVETPDGLIKLERDTKRAKPGTRRRFPQQSANLTTRWCSSAAKIDVARRALNNQPRFNASRTLLITGERREESNNRAKYNQLEAHFCDRSAGKLARHIDHWRPVLNWSEEQVWDALERHRVIAPVPYRLSWPRSSCQACVFNDGRVWATLHHHFPQRVIPIARYEDEFETAISRDKKTVLQRAAEHRPLEIDDLDALRQAQEEDYTLPIFVPMGQKWIMPPGAFARHGCGAS